MLAYYVLYAIEFCLLAVYLYFHIISLMEKYSHRITLCELVILGLSVLIQVPQIFVEKSINYGNWWHSILQLFLWSILFLTDLLIYKDQKAATVGEGNFMYSAADARKAAAACKSEVVEKLSIFDKWKLRWLEARIKYAARTGKTSIIIHGIISWQVRLELENQGYKIENHTNRVAGVCDDYISWSSID